MRIKEILIESFRSPFANLLAIANLTMMALVGSYASFRPGGYADLVCDLNLPAILAAMILMRSTDAGVLVPPLIYLQWIFIAAFAKFVSYHAKPSLN